MKDASESTRVVILTNNYKITGYISLLPGSRLTDYIRDSKNFIAVTEAFIADREGRELFKGNFLNVSCNHIEIILPADQAG